MTAKRLPTWPLWLLAAPAGVAIWSGWVGLGGMTGFGPVTLLPGISDLRINTAITLPVGMEVYAAYALRAWLGADVGVRARAFARRSAIGALVAGAAGQIAYHLMAAAHWREAPWPVTIAVSCVPVAVLGMGAALAHLLREPGDEPVSEVAHEPVTAADEPAPVSQPEPVDEPAREPHDEPVDEPVDEPQPDAGPSTDEPAAEPVAEPQAQRVRLRVVGQRRPARTKTTTRRAPTKPSDPRAGQRYACGCGCGRQVSRATKDRHEATAAAETGTP